MEYVHAFWVGGLICAAVQILMDRTKMMPGRIMVLLVKLYTSVDIRGYTSRQITTSIAGPTKTHRVTLLP